MITDSLYLVQELETVQNVVSFSRNYHLDSTTGTFFQVIGQCRTRQWNSLFIRNPEPFRGYTGPFTTSFSQSFSRPFRNDPFEWSFSSRHRLTRVYSKSNVIALTDMKILHRYTTTPISHTSIRQPSENTPHYREKGKEE